MTAASLLPGARACEFPALHLKIVHPWTRPAVAGDSFAVLWMRFEDVIADDRLIGVETPVARTAEINGVDGRGPVDIPIPAGRDLAVGDHRRSLRLMHLLEPLELARQYPLRLVFERSGTVVAALNVEPGRFF
jgi:copper(I)-binding protein